MIEHQTSQIFDRLLVRQHRDRSADRFNDYNFLFTEIADRLVDRLNDIKRRFTLILDLGGHDGYMSRVRASRDARATILVCDLSHRLLKQAQGLKVVADEEWLPFADQRFDLVLSNLSMHWINDLPGALIQIHRTLKPDGFFLGSMFGGQTLGELRHVLMETELHYYRGSAPRISPFADVRDAGSLLQRAQLSLPVVDTETVTVTYESLYHLMLDLRGMGETNALLMRSKQPISKAFFAHAARHYQTLFGTSDGRIIASFQILYLAGWAAHESQPLALKPGTAKTRLAHALGTIEQATGDVTPIPKRDRAKTD